MALLQNMTSAEVQQCNNTCLNGVDFSHRVPRNTCELKHHDNKILRAEQSNLLSEGYG